jgi:hypothetical protein
MVADLGEAIAARFYGVPPVDNANEPWYDLISRGGDAYRCTLRSTPTLLLSEKQYSAQAKGRCCNSREALVIGPSNSRVGVATLPHRIASLPLTRDHVRQGSRYSVLLSLRALGSGEGVLSVPKRVS